MDPHLDRIHRFVQQEAPQFRPVVKRRPDLVATIPVGLTDAQLDLELYRIAKIYEADLTRRGEELLRQMGK